jgi:hypothetical protein
MRAPVSEGGGTMKLRGRLDRVERQLPAPPEPTPRDRRLDRRWQAVAGRLIDLLQHAAELMNESEFRQAEDALTAYVNGTRGPLDRWLDDLRAGRSRLPELTPPAMKDLLSGWLHPQAGQPMVCNGCGLEYPRLRRPGAPNAARPANLLPAASTVPYQVARLFDACPGCGASRYDTTWPGRTASVDLPWKALDGWMDR